MGFSLKLVGLGSLSLTCSAIFLNAISAAGFYYELLFFLLFLAVTFAIAAFAGLFFAFAIQTIGLLIITLLEHFSLLQQIGIGHVMYANHKNLA